VEPLGTVTLWVISAFLPTAALIIGIVNVRVTRANSRRGDRCPRRVRHGWCLRSYSSITTMVIEISWHIQRENDTLDACLPVRFQACLAGG